MKRFYIVALGIACVAEVVMLIGTNVSFGQAFFGSCINGLAISVSFTAGRMQR